MNWLKQIREEKRLKMKTLFQISVLALLSLVAETPARAQPTAAQTSASQAKSAELTPLQREMAKFDLNKNGKLEPAERQAYLAAQLNRRDDFVKKWDANADGVLDETERGRARAAWQKALKLKKAAASASPSVPAKKQ